jgi:hypothetical protein
LPGVLRHPRKVHAERCKGVRRGHLE